MPNSENLIEQRTVNCDVMPLEVRDVCRYAIYFEDFFWRTDAAKVKDAKNVDALKVTIFVTFRGMDQRLPILLVLGPYFHENTMIDTRAFCQEA